MAEVKKSKVKKSSIKKDARGMLMGRGSLEKFKDLIQTIKSEEGIDFGDDEGFDTLLEFYMNCVEEYNAMTEGESPQFYASAKKSKSKSIEVKKSNIKKWNLNAFRRFLIDNFNQDELADCIIEYMQPSDIRRVMDDYGYSEFDYSASTKKSENVIKSGNEEPLLYIIAQEFGDDKEGWEQLAVEMVRAMSDTQAKEILGYIARNWDIDMMGYEASTKKSKIKKGYSLSWGEDSKGQKFTININGRPTDFEYTEDAFGTFESSDKSVPFALCLYDDNGELDEDNAHILVYRSPSDIEIVDEIVLPVDSFNDAVIQFEKWANNGSTWATKKSKMKKEWPNTSKAYENMWEKYVPKSGEANTIFGEVLRCASRVIYRYYNDGDIYNMGYGKETINPPLKYLKNQNEYYEIKSIAEEISNYVKENRTNLKWCLQENINNTGYDALLNKLSQAINTICEEKEAEDSKAESEEASYYASTKKSIPKSNDTKMSFTENVNKMRVNNYAKTGNINTVMKKRD